MNRSPARPEPSEIPHLAAGAPACAGQLILERRRRLVEPLMAGSEGHLVDFGCGNGEQTLLLAGRFARVTGLDVNESFLASFREVFARHLPGTEVEARRVDESPSPLAAGCADVVTSFTVLEHVPDDAAALAEMARLLRPGGRLILSVPNRWWIFETHGADLPLLPWNRVPLVSWWPRGLHDRYARARIYDRNRITTLVEAAGFHIDDLFHMTAPMDMISWEPLRRLARRTLFRRDRASLPVLATEILVAATR